MKAGTMVSFSADRLPSILAEVEPDTLHLLSSTRPNTARFDLALIRWTDGGQLNYGERTVTAGAILAESLAGAVEAFAALEASVGVPVRQ